MSAIAQKNLAAFRAMKRTHAINAAGTELEISAPALLKSSNAYPVNSALT